MLSSAAEEACRQLITIGRFPICALHLTVPFENVDVNVHPNKWEVRFTNENQIRQSVLNIISDALIRDRHENQRIPSVFENTQTVQKLSDVTVKPSSPQQSAPSVAVSARVIPEKAAEPEPVAPPVRPAVIQRTQPAALHNNVSGMAPRPAVIPQPMVSHVSIPAKKNESMHSFPSSAPKAADLKSKSSTVVQPPQTIATPEPEQIEQLEHNHVALHFKDKPIHMLGVAFDTYIILQYEDRLLLCDQHAIHERLLYEKFLRETASAPASQTFLIPCIIQLNRAEYNAFAENRDALQKAGFDAEDFGDLCVQLRGIPFVLGQPQAERCFLDALDELCESGSISQQNKVQRIIQMACKHAVKGGERLPHDALIDLVRRMLTEDIRLTCPHGRPLMVELSRTDLEKRFKRIQN